MTYVVNVEQCQPYDPVLFENLVQNLKREKLPRLRKVNVIVYGSLDENKRVLGSVRTMADNNNDKITGLSLFNIQSIMESCHKNPLFMSY